MSLTGSVVVVVQVPGHPILLERLDAASRYLARKYPGESGAEIAKRITVGGATDKVRLGAGSSYHAFGMAIDIDVGRNPYIAGETPDDDASDLDRLTIARTNLSAIVAIWHAVWLFGEGAAYSPAAATEWNELELTTREMYRTLKATSDALSAYTGLANGDLSGMPADFQGTSAEDAFAHLIDRMAEAPGIPTLPPMPKTNDQATADQLASLSADATATMERALTELSPMSSPRTEIIARWRRAAARHHQDLYTEPSGGAGWGVKDAQTRKVKTRGFLSFGEDLVVALRDVAELAWGATDIGSVANGDMQHFDCRRHEAAKTINEFRRDKKSAKEVLDE